MRILICSEQAPVPPLEDGIRIPLHAIRERLAGRHEIQVVAFYRPHEGEPDTSGPGLELVAWPATSSFHDAALVAQAELTGRPLRADSLARRMRPSLRRAAHAFDPDVVHVVTGQIAGVHDAIGDRPAVLAAQDAWHRNVEAARDAATGLRERVYRREIHRVKRFEYREYRRYDAVVVVSQEDAAALDSLGHGMALHVIPNGVETTRFAPDAGVHAVPSRIVFHGNLNYAPNISAARMLAEQIFPLVRARVPTASLVIAGRNPVREVRALEDQNGAVQVAANVEDVRPWLLSASAYAAPIHTGTGIKNKVLEALACGLPCVATTRALQGLEAVEGRDVLVADDPSEFATKLVDVLATPELARRLGAAGRAYVSRDHTWDAVTDTYEALYASVVESYRRRATAA